MKICPKCHTKYDDSMSFCVKDGCQLQENLSGETPTTSSKPNKRKGCLKAFIITLVVFILGIFLLYRHVMNAATYLRTEPEVLTAAKGGEKLILIMMVMYGLLIINRIGLVLMSLRITLK
ncbi:hypothetical protein [Bacteroides sp. OF04-15BH]|uniref:hypothetical protein n=1 Tax=Bacteroides sp. OF04-15BH TaxID=2292281 RepID=UPI000E53F84F|nr:hypothetical protein [Bacteroides sp. OF04-15BH]RHP64122.1 hypothetical protein DXA74_08890 [Bacteroides sp. OF04-15BH]